MKKSNLLLILSLLLSSVLIAQTETRDLSSFSQVSASEGIEVTMKKGAKESAEVTVDGIPMDEVITEVSGSSLKIYLEGNNHRNVDVQVYVTYVSLEGLKSSSASSIRVEDRVIASGDFDIACSSAGSITLMLKADEVEIDVSSSGDVDVELEANDLEIEVSSSGEVEISGKVNEIEVSASSAGEVDGYDLICGEADLRASSGASIKLTVNESIEARASSGGSIRYKGSPKYSDTDSSSGGSVKKS